MPVILLLIKVEAPGAVLEMCANCPGKRGGGWLAKVGLEMDLNADQSRLSGSAASIADGIISHDDGGMRDSRVGIRQVSPTAY